MEQQQPGMAEAAECVVQEQQAVQWQQQSEKAPVVQLGHKAAEDGVQLVYRGGQLHVEAGQDST
jgi:hypothetical protein